MAALAGLGILLCFVGIIAAVIGLFQRMKAKRVADAPFVSTGDAARNGAAVASPKGAISAQGQVRCALPVIAPMSGTPALWYKLTVTSSWSDGKQTRTRELETQQAAAAFTIDDGSGELYIDARKGGDFTPTLSRQETKGTGLIGGITGQELVFGNHRVSPGVLSMGEKFTVREEVLPVESRLYVCGKVGDRSITSPDWRRLLISNKTRAELFESVEKSAKILLFGGGGAFAAGLLFAIVGSIFAPPVAKAASTSTTAAETAAADSSQNTDDSNADDTKPADPSTDTKAETTPAPKTAAKPVANATHGAAAKPSAATGGAKPAASTKPAASASGAPHH